MVIITIMIVIIIVILIVIIYIFFRENWILRYEQREDTTVTI